MREYPYAHLYIDNVFPGDFYARFRSLWPADESLVSLADTGRVPKGAYRERFILPFQQSEIAKLDDRRREFWLEFGDWFLSPRFMQAVIDKFAPYVRERFGDAMFTNYYSSESLIVRDQTNYAIEIGRAHV